MKNIILAFEILLKNIYENSSPQLDVQVGQWSVQFSQAPSHQQGYHLCLGHKDWPANSFPNTQKQK